MAKNGKIKNAAKIGKSIDRKLKKAKEQKRIDKLKDPNAPKQVPHTKTDIIVADEKLVEIDKNCSVEALDEIFDNLIKYQIGRNERGEKNKTLITHINSLTTLATQFCKDLAENLTTCEYQPYVRCKTIEKIIKEAREQYYTHMIIVSEPRKCGSGKSGACSMMLFDLSGGPLFFFKIQSLILKQKIKNSGQNSAHEPELIMKGFSSKMGSIVSTILSCALTNQIPNLKGRKALTLLNKQDFVFFRLHRYIFDKKGETSMQEIGPRFTLRLLKIFKTHNTSKKPIWEYARKKDLKSSKTNFVL